MTSLESWALVYLVPRVSVGAHPTSEGRGLLIRLRPRRGGALLRRTLAACGTFLLLGALLTVLIFLVEACVIEMVWREHHGGQGAPGVR
jgi:hypothetical protein